MVERQDPDKFTRFQTRERCALEIAAYVLNVPEYLWYTHIHVYAGFKLPI